MQKKRKVETFKLLGKMFPKYTIGEALKALEEGVNVEVFRLKALSGRATKHDLKEIA